VWRDNLGMGIRPRRLGHVGLGVRDMERMVEFDLETIDVAAFLAWKAGA